MNRRDYLKKSAIVGGTLGLGLPFNIAAEPKLAEQFQKATKNKPWLKAYESITQDDYSATAKVTGKWPKELRGTLYRNGPAQHEVYGYRYTHWFDGDGMMQAYRIGDQGVSHQAKLVETYKVKAERKAQRALYPGFASAPPNPAPVTSPDSVNVANISVLHHGDKLMALWEAGSPWEIDPNNLSTKGTHVYSDHTKGVPFSAHPRVEADGTLWNFGYLSGANLFVLWHIDAKGNLVKVGKIQSDPITMVHDFVVTDKHIVMLVPPFHYQAEAGFNTFLDAHQWAPNDPTRVLVVNKDNFDDHYWLELPSQWVFHFGNAWEDKNGVIHFDAARADDPLVMIDTFRALMRGEMEAAAPSHHHLYQIDTKQRKVREMPILADHIDSEFPCVDPRVSCRRNRHLTFMSSNQQTAAVHGSLNEVSTFSFDSGEQRSFRYPDHQIPEEHLFVPKPGSKPEVDGWIIGSAVDWKNGHQLLNVFAAANVADGPIASAQLPYRLPLGLHGKFVAT